LESLVGEAVLAYLYAEFDDGKDVLVKMSQDMWQAVKSRVDLDSRRWFPQSAEAFGKELRQLKQALSHKGFELSEGTVGTGNQKRKANRIVRSDELGRLGRFGQVENDRTYPDESRIDMPESARSKEPGQVGQVLSTFSSSKKKRKIKRKKNTPKKTYPTYPEPEKQGESGVDKPKNPGQVDAETTYQNLPKPTHNRPTPMGTSG
jgi:hypothetical protein